MSYVQFNTHPKFMITATSKLSIDGPFYTLSCKQVKRIRKILTFRAELLVEELINWVSAPLRCRFPIPVIDAQSKLHFDLLKNDR